MHPYNTKHRNAEGRTAMELFIETHEEPTREWAKWLNNAAQSCSVVAALIISVVFVSITTVPGGLVQDQGPPVYRGKLAFDVYSVSSLLALSSSSISLIMFLGILTSPYQDSDFENELARKWIYGLASLFISIEAMFLSFFTGDQFVLDSKIRFIAYPIFVLTSCVALVGFPFYSEVWQIITDLPIRNYPSTLAF